MPVADQHQFRPAGSGATTRTRKVARNFGICHPKVAAQRVGFAAHRLYDVQGDRAIGVVLAGPCTSSWGATMSEQDVLSFGAVLRHRRLVAGLTQEALAERSGLGLRSIQGLERGETQPRRETLQRLVEALRLTAEQIPAFEQAGQPLPRQRQDATPCRRDARAHNLPAQLTSFVGRERELAELAARLRASAAADPDRHRRLRQDPAGAPGRRAAASPRYPDGVWLVELAALADPALVGTGGGAALGVREEPGQPMLETLLDAAPRTPAAAGAGQLRAPARRLRRAGRRAAARLPAACASWPPAASRWASPARSPGACRRCAAPPRRRAAAAAPDDLAQYEAVRLFVERARGGAADASR